MKLFIFKNCEACIIFDTMFYSHLWVNKEQQFMYWFPTSNTCPLPKAFLFIYIFVYRLEKSFL